MAPAATDHDHEIVGVTHDAIGGQAMPSPPSPVDPGGHVGLPDLGEVLVEDGSDVGQQREEDPALGCASLGVAGDALLGQHPGFQERLDQPQDALVGMRLCTRASSAGWEISSKHAEMSASSTHS